MHNASSKTHPPIAMPTTAQNDWHTELNLPGSYQVAHLRNLIISLPSFAERVPAQEIILSNKHEGEGDKLVSALRSSKDLWALIYTPEGEPVKTAFEAHEAQWFDPRTGKRQAAVQEKGVYTPPTSGSIEEDWCLVLLA